VFWFEKLGGDDGIQITFFSGRLFPTELNQQNNKPWTISATTEDVSVSLGCGTL